MEEIFTLIRKFSEERDWDKFHTGANLAKSLCIEAAELLELYQWSDEVKSIESLKEELADVLVYALSICDKYGFDYKEIIIEKMKKNALKYPIEKAKGNALKYDEYDN